MKRLFQGFLALTFLIVSIAVAHGAGTPGTLKWSYTTEGGVSSVPAIGSDGTIYAGSYDSNLYAINPDGTLKWSYATGGEIGASHPAIGADGTIYVGSHDNKLYAISSTGALKWSYATDGKIESTPAIGADGTIYVGSLDSSLYAISSTGALKWSYATEDAIWSSPAIGSDGTIYVGSDDHSLYAISSTGAFKWAYTAGAVVTSSPAIGSDGTIYVGSYDGNLYAINPGGTLKWHYATGDKIYASPAIGADGTIYVGSADEKVHAVNSSGVVKWTYSAGGTTGSPAIGADGTIYVSTAVKKLYALNSSGTLKWSYAAKYGAASSLAIGADGTLYMGAGSDGERLYAIYSSSMGHADSAWPVFHRDPAHTGNAATAIPLALVVTISGSGAVTSDPSGIDCGTTCAAFFTSGTSVTLTAEAASGSTFTGWSGGGCSGTGTCTVDMESATSVTASFNTPSSCVYTIAPSSKTFTSKAGTTHVTVTGKGEKGVTCTAPDVTSSATSWITATLGGWTNNKGKVTVTVAENAATSGRTGSVAIDGKTFAVSQKGGTCTITGINPTSQPVPVSGGAYSFNVTVSPQDCAWTTSANKTWITLDTTGGTGSGTVAYDAAANATNKTQTGAVTVTLTGSGKKKTHTVKQAGK